MFCVVDRKSCVDARCIAAINLFPFAFVSFICITLFKFCLGGGKMVSNEPVNGVVWLIYTALLIYRCVILKVH
jgi:hypothetical protein